MTFDLELQEAGLNALEKALGSEKTVEFIKQINQCRGDYTKEKYETESLTAEEIDKLLEAYDPHYKL